MFCKVLKLYWNSINPKSLKLETTLVFPKPGEALESCWAGSAGSASAGRPMSGMSESKSVPASSWWCFRHVGQINLTPCHDINKDSLESPHLNFHGTRLLGLFSVLLFLFECLFKDNLNLPFSMNLVFAFSTVTLCPSKCICQYLPG